MELLGVLPREIWYLIVGDSGLVFKSLFLVSKLLHKYMDQVKDQYVLNVMPHNPYNKHDNFNVLLLKHNTNTYDLKFIGNHYFLDIPTNIKHIKTSFQFTGYNNLKCSLCVYVSGIIRFFIRDKTLYDSKNLNEYDTYEDMPAYIKIIKDQIDDSTNFTDDEITLVLLGCDGDIVATIMVLMA